MISVNRHHEAAYSGLGTFCKAPLALTPEDLDGADVGILGAPFDEGVSYRPGARLGPRAIRQACNYLWSPPARPHMNLGIDPFEVLEVVDYGDAECPPADLAASHREVKARLAELLAADVFPVVLGGDHSLAYPDVVTVVERFGVGNVGLIQFDTHSDTAPVGWGGKLSHASPMRRLVEEGHIVGEHFIQVGLHGYFPDPEDFAWMRSVGMRWHSRYEIDRRGMAAVVEELIATAGRDLPPQVFVSFDIDVFDDLYAPGTGSLESGGLTPREVFPALNRIFAELPVVGMELVEVAPTYDPANITALLAHRCVLESLAGLALRRSGRTRGADPV
ncbi:MAG: agmatinase family protein [Solirubrobacterales bacterium]